MDSEICVVKANGDTKYSFSVKEEILLQKCSSKGWSIRANTKLKEASTILSNAAVVCIVCGINKSRICMHCYKRIQKIVKVRDDCKNLSYCSTTCLSLASDFIDTCGTVIDDIYAMGVSSASSDVGAQDLMCMAVKLFYVYLRQESVADLTSLDCVLKCETHAGIENHEIRSLSQKLFEVLQKNKSPLLFNSSGSETFNQFLLYRILCAFQYNSQPLPIPGIKGVHIVSLFPTLSKLNHCCSPNAVLKFGIHQNHVIGYLKLLTNVDNGEEICISYLNQPCVNYKSRQDFLFQAFQFKCMCELCTQQSCNESSEPSTLELENDQLTSSSSKGLMNNAKSGGDNAINVSIQMSKAEELLAAAATEDDSEQHSAAVTAYDTALLVLQYCQGVTDSTNEVNILALRACLVVCACIQLCGGCFLLSRVEFLIMCGQYALKGKMNGEVLSSDLIHRVKTVLLEAEQILGTHYGRNCRRSTGLLDSDYLAGSGQLMEYYDNLLSRCKQLRTALT